MYKITGLYYSKPRVAYNPSGEVVTTRQPVYLLVGQPSDWGKKVESIEYDKELKSFRVTFPKGGLLIVPYLPDTEVFYEEIEKTKKK